nr:EOG090X0JBP [Eulimnadia texana]
MLRPSQFKDDTDVYIQYEDQQKINKFARLNARWEELKEDIKAKQNEVQNLDDASTELMMVEDESLPIPYVIGEVFVHLTIDEAREKLETTKSDLEKEITSLEEECTKLKEGMSDLKTQLYAKFGSSINLEADDD